MLTISAIKGEYRLKSLSGGTYHELTLVTKGTISADISIQVRREAADVFEQYSNYTARTPTTFITTYGEKKIGAGARYATRCAQTGPLYSYAATTAVAHVMVG